MGSVPVRGDSEGVEIAVPGFWCRSVVIVTKEVIQQDLSETSQFLQTTAMFGIGNGQTEQFESAFQRPAASLLFTPGLPVQGALHLAADIAQLDDEGEFPPPTGRQ